MTADAQRIAIAEAVGFRWMRRKGSRDCWLFAPDAKATFDGRIHRLDLIVGEFEPCERPELTRATYEVFGSFALDYPDSLEAMHQAEKTLDKTQRIDYVRELYQVTNGDFEFHCATAAQRATAFLRALNLYQPEGGDL